MAYEKHEWASGETITADLLNHMEDGIANSEGYSCSSKTMEYFNGSETTTTFYNGGYKGDVFQLSDDLSADEITVVFDGTEYVAEKNSFYGTIYYGATFSGGFFFENIPFCIYDVKNGTAQLVTENTGTYSLTISATEDKIETSECFEKAVKKHSIKNVADSSLANGAVVEGNVKRNVASGDSSHAEGINTTASGDSSHAEGINTTASGSNSHAEGTGTTASGSGSHAEGMSTTASGDSSHAEGEFTTASGSGSHAEGSNTTASGNYSHAGNHYTIAQGESQTVIGKFNVAQGSADSSTATDYAFIIGNGDYNNRSNALAVKWDGTFVFGNGTEISPAQFASILALLS